VTLRLTALKMVGVSMLGGCFSVAAVPPEPHFATEEERARRLERTRGGQPLPAWSSPRTAGLRAADGLSAGFMGSLTAGQIPKA
jgi:hypothetical protein